LSLRLCLALPAVNPNKPKLDNLAGDIWKSAERLRGKFKSYEYQSVILPIIVIRRLECVLIDWRERKAAEVLANRPKLTEPELAKLVKELELNPKQCPFSNRTDWTLRKSTRKTTRCSKKLPRLHQRVLEERRRHHRALQLPRTIGQMVKNNRLAPILNQYKELALGPDQLSGLEMGYIYEELLRRFSEQSGEEAGEHFTPREVIRLMVELLDIPIPDRHLSIYDPASGTGGMLSVAKEHLLERADTPEKERGSSNWSPSTARNYVPDQLRHLSGRSADQERPASHGPSRQLADPARLAQQGAGRPVAGEQVAFSTGCSAIRPFGVTWGGKDGYEKEARKLEKTRYRAGHAARERRRAALSANHAGQDVPAREGGSRIAIIFNGSPLSNGDCGSGESEIRRWILENDWLDAIVMLPDQLFYNTGIFTYIWLLRNDKPASHRGRVMLIDARQQFEKEPKSFGNKRNRITDRTGLDRAALPRGWEGLRRRARQVFRREDFAYHKVSVVFWQTDEHDQPATVTEPYEKAFTAANLKKEQEFYASELTFRVRLKIGVPTRRADDSHSSPRTTPPEVQRSHGRRRADVWPSSGRTGTTSRTTNTSPTARTSRNF
jgi:type I restriction enzyme M protein